ncbi:MAG: hypothetical protein ACREV4_11860 [Gammaproteobacteria bacterium]
MNLLINPYPHWRHLIAMAVFLSACQSLPPARVSTPPERTSKVAVHSPLISALLYVEQVSQWPDDQKKQEVARLKSKADENIGQRLQLALLLMRADTPVGDDAHAMELLASTHALTDGDEAGLNFLRTLLSDRVQTQARNRRSQAMGSVERRNCADVERTNETVILELAKEREQTKRLQGQLDALKRIEQKINDRAKPLEVPPNDVERIQAPAGR